MILTCTVNGDKRQVLTKSQDTLADVLRQAMGLTGTKIACDMGECGSCTVLVDGVPQLSCMLLGQMCEGKRIVTVEGLSQGGKLSTLQQAFHKNGAAQCGFCTPGILIAATDLLEHNPAPTLAEVKLALSGNICRCTGYKRIFEAVLEAAEELQS